MTSDDDLVSYLRPRNWQPRTDHDVLLNDAADRIEALTAELARAEARAECNLNNYYLSGELVEKLAREVEAERALADQLAHAAIVSIDSYSQNDQRTVSGKAIAAWRARRSPKEPTP